MKNRNLKRMLLLVTAIVLPVILKGQTNYTLGDWMSDNAGVSNSQSSITYTITTIPGSYISFIWEVSSENGCDVFTVMIDDGLFIGASGRQSDTFNYYFYDNGIHTITFSYEKDGSVNDYEDCARVTQFYAYQVLSVSNNGPIYIELENSGTLESKLNEIIGDISGSDNVELKISGSVNASDFLSLRNILTMNYYWSNGIAAPNHIQVDLGDVIIEDSYAFNAYGEKKVTMPTVFPAILNYYCDIPFGMKLPSSVEKIQESALYGSALDNIELPENLVSIGNWAFRDTNLRSFMLPSRVSEVGVGILADCEFLEEIKVDRFNSTFHGWLSANYNLNAIVGQYDRKVYAGCNNTRFDLVDFLEIGPQAFMGCQQLTSLDLSSVKVIEFGAFSGCANLENVVLGNSLTKIGHQAFHQLPKLTHVELPVSLDSLALEAFSGCNLSEVFIPKNVRWYGKVLKSLPFMSTWHDYENDYYYCLSPFGGNDNLKKITVDPENPYLYSVNDTCIVEKESLTLLDGFGIFKIPEEVQIIAPYSTYRYSSDSINIPKNVKVIYVSNFYGVKKIVCESNEPPIVLGYIHTPSKLNGTNSTLYVHFDNLSSYVEHDSWDNFKEYRAIENPISLSDSKEYTNSIQLNDVNITYTRTFNNTNWQALYVPFNMSYEDWSEDFEVAAINMFHQYDDDEDGLFDRMEMEVRKVQAGTLKPNHPYLIKAKSTGEKTISLTDATLYAADENSFECNSMEMKYTFTGTYTGVTGSTMVSEGYYSMGGGNLIQAENASSNLNPYRWYQKMEARDGQVILPPASVKVCVWGEDDEEDGILSLDNEKENAPIYNLNGTKVVNANRPGLYIKNGKKYVVR